MANGGTDGRTDVWKFPPVFYRTSALWGRYPKRRMRRRRSQRRIFELSLMIG